MTTDTGAKNPIEAIFVVGSANMDLVARCQHIPAAGETILATEFALYTGGKGANGASAAAHLARRHRVAMIGMVGRDDNGATLLRNLRAHGVDTTYVNECDAVPTGIALIAVTDVGENSIVVVPGANARLRPHDVDKALPAVGMAVILLQMEIPLETVVHAAQRGRHNAAYVLLDPAPVPQNLPAELLNTIDVLLPNEGELATLAGMPVQTEEDAVQAATLLRERGVRIVVVKRGAQGALIVDERGIRVIPTPRVTVVDTTGAGDCFDGALAVALAEGQDIDSAARFATHAAALACTRLGAQKAQPNRDDVHQLLEMSHDMPP